MATETNLLEQILGCSSSEATHYLKIFNGDAERAVRVVSENQNDGSWWGHPWNAEDKSVFESDENMDTPRHSDLRSQAFSSAASETKDDDSVSVGSFKSGVHHDVTIVETIDPDTDSFAFVDPYVNATSSILTAEELFDDRVFYNHYCKIVDHFIDTVCGADITKGDLRRLISKADMMVNRDTGSEMLVSDIVNRPSFLHNEDKGRTPLSYAVAKNLKARIDDLLDLGADVSGTMTSQDEEEPASETALTIAATNQKRDGTEMLRILLSKGANPDEISSAGVDEKSLGLTMRYWLDKARRIGVPNQNKLAHLKKTPPMDRLHELDYAVVGEEAAVSVIREALAGRFGNPQGNRKPLVMLLLGPPGHGKTYFASNAAQSLVGEENFLFIPCQSIRDDADLFGSRLGGARNGTYSSDGQLTNWLRHRQGKKCIVFLDEFEKMQELTSALGWGQAKKIFQSFLEPWNDGKLSDQGASSGTLNGHADPGSAGGDKIDCSQCIWIMTSNWGQSTIIDFCEKNKARMSKKIGSNDVAWIQNDLVKKILRPLCIREFGSVHEDVKALCRRIDAIVPFLSFTPKEKEVVADTVLTERFSLYREPCVTEGPEEKRRSLGNLRLQSTKSFVSYTANSYDPMQGASSMLAVAQQIDGKFQMMFVRDMLGLTPEQEERITDPKPSSASEEPVFWVHYDKKTSEISITQSMPLDDEEEGSHQHNGVEDDLQNLDPFMRRNEVENVDLPDEYLPRASSDAF